MWFWCDFQSQATLIFLVSISSIWLLCKHLHIQKHQRSVTGWPFASCLHTEPHGPEPHGPPVHSYPPPSSCLDGLVLEEGFLQAMVIAVSVHVTNGGSFTSKCRAQNTSFLVFYLKFLWKSHSLPYPVLKECTRKFVFSGDVYKIWLRKSCDLTYGMGSRLEFQDLTSFSSDASMTRLSCLTYIKWAK